MFAANPSFWKDRIRAAAIHFGLSCAVAVVAAMLVFGIWYPYPYREISGGRELFLIVVTVDVIMGPLITLAVFDRRKPMSELRRDLVVVGSLQLLALAYGLWTVSLARPVHLVFEYDRFRVVHAVDVPDELLSQTPAGLTAMPLAGPTLLSLRPFNSESERAEATLAALKGLALSARPDLWQPYGAAADEIRRQARPVAELRRRLHNQSALIDAAVSQTGRSPGTLVYVPMIGRRSFWTVLLDATTNEIMGFIPLDAF